MKMRILVLSCALICIAMLGSCSMETSAKANGQMIRLPAYVYGVTDREMNIYFDNIILCENLDDYQIDVECSVGNQLTERWTWVPDAPGEYPLVISLYQDGTKKVASAATAIKVSPADSGAGKNIKCLFIGDSTMKSGKCLNELYKLQNLDGMKLTFLGTQGEAPLLHEGRDGWRAIYYLNSPEVKGVANSFWNASEKRFDFGYYMRKANYSDVQCVCVQLGINDVFAYQDDKSLLHEIDNVIIWYDRMISGIHEYNSGIKIGICLTIPPAASQDAFGDNYHSGQTWWRYKRNNYLFVERLTDKYGGREAESIYLVPINVALDTENGFKTKFVSENGRSGKLVERHINALHPNDSGYGQIADGIWGWLKAVFGS